jgi:hypothetical protein
MPCEGTHVQAQLSQFESERVRLQEEKAAFEKEKLRKDALERSAREKSSEALRKPGM